MTTWTKGPWRVGRAGAVVADHPVPGMSGSGDIEYYGGHLIAESVTKENAPVLAASPELFDALAEYLAADLDCSATVDGDRDANDRAINRLVDARKVAGALLARTRGESA